MKLNVKLRSVAVAGATLSAAALVGVFVQSSGPSEASAVATEPVEPVKAVTASAAVLPVDEFGFNFPSDSSDIAELPVRTVALNVATDIPTSEMPAEESAPLLGCEVSLRAVPAVAAMVNLHVNASCLPNARIRVEHDKLRFSEFLDAAGALTISVPALKVDSRFTVVMPNGSETNAVVNVPDLTLYNRMVLQWTGESGLQIHAREFGADYGQKGHVSFERQGDLIDLVSGKAGYLMRLGDGMTDMSLMADVYTFPAGEMPVEMTIEAEVQSANCNRDITATTMQINEARVAGSHDIQFAMPECDATGDFLVLKNLFQNRTIAQQ